MNERVREFYASVASWVAEHARERSPERPIFVGINGPQGSGKSTLTHSLVRLLDDLGLRAVSLSIDDFYLTRAEQVALATRHPDNPCFAQRGYPGTHDLSLGETTLLELASLGAGNGRARCPVYDKSAHAGQGDRKPEAEWKTTTAPLDVVFLEGWMLGFAPVDKSQLPNAHFEPVNEALAEYKRWTSFFDLFLHLSPMKTEFVVDWRIEAEERMKAEGKAGMTTGQIRAYVEKFLPAYETYLPGLRSHPPETPTPACTIVIGQDRLPLSLSVPE